MLAQLNAMLSKKVTRKAELGQKAAKTESVDELRSINTEVEILNSEIADIRSMITDLENEQRQQGGDNGEGENQQGANGEDEQRGNGGQGGITPSRILGTYGIRGAQPQRGAEQRGDNEHDTLEYRSAFMDYVQRGEQSDALEFRADATTQLGDIGAVIPTTILNRIVQKLRESGRIWSRISQSSVQGGIQIPISSLKPKATWVKPGKMSDKQKMDVSQYIVFSYHKLQCRVAVELVAGTVSLAMFEDMIVENVYEAMIVALDEGIINGSGVLEPLGIVNDPSIKEEQIIYITSDDMSSWQAWNVILGKQKRSYRSGSVIILADEDWNKYIQGATDANGQPIGRVNNGIVRGGQPQEFLLHREALPVEELLPSIDDAQVGDTIAVLVNLSDYMMNSNMQLTYRRYFDENTDEWIDKATLIADGKLADRNGVVLIKKGENSILADPAKKNA